MTLYFSNPAATLAPRRAEIENAISSVISKGRYVLGAEVSAFEHSFAAFCEIDHAVGVANGTDALSLALLAAGAEPGDEVITVSHTAVATAAAIAQVGAVPVFVDVDPQSYTMEPKALAGVLSSKTRFIVPVHLYGQPADMDPILNFARQNRLIVIEDCAQAHGARYKGHRVGSMGDFGCFSFYPTKNLAGIGDGGAVVTRDVDSAKRIRQLRAYGWDDKRCSQTVGMNSRLDELQAAILRINLNYLTQETVRRQTIATQYSEAIADLPIQQPQLRPDCEHVFHLYVIATDQRDNLKTHLSSEGIEPGIHYAIPTHLQTPYRLYRHNGLPVTERAVGRILSLPMYPALSDENVEHVVGALRAFFD